MRSKIEDARDAVDSVFGKGFALAATVERAAFGRQMIAILLSMRGFVGQ